MKENICTIPINDIFKKVGGCPICRMHKLVEEQYVAFVTGSAMMAPDVRVKTNEQGFCHHHYDMMVKTGPKLSNALLMQTRLGYINDNMMPKKLSDKPSKAMLDMIRKARSSCYVCERINNDIDHLLKTFFVQFAADVEFRQLLKSQEYICLDHYELLMTKAQSKGGLKSKDMKDFCETINTLTKGYLCTLYDDVTHLTTMFDYRNAGGDWKNSKDSTERSIAFLTGKEVTE